MHKLLHKNRPSRPRSILSITPALSAGRVWRDEVPSEAQMRQGFWVSSVGYHINQPPHTMSTDWTPDCFCAVFISRGRGFFESSVAGRHGVESGTMMWIVPGVTHTYCPDKGTWDEHWIEFGGKVADELHREGMISAERPLLNVGGDADVAGLVTRIEEVFLNDNPLSVALASALTQQLIIVCHGISSGLLHREKPLDPAIAQTLRLIEHEAISGINVKTLPRRVHLGYSTLRRRFKQQTGYTIKDYILRQRLRRAKELLVVTARPIGEIARIAGFDNPLYFSRIFAQREGVSPRAFRKKARSRRAGRK